MTSLQIRQNHNRYIESLWADRRLEIVVQNICDVSNPSKVLYGECLVRIKDQNNVSVLPGSFLSAFELSGAITTLDRCVLSLVLEKLDSDPELTLGCNFSVQNLLNDTTWNDLYDLIASRSDLHSRLIIELTESAPIRKNRQTMKRVKSLRDLGCRVAFDDFGAGYMVPGCMPSTSMDIIKIDASVILFNGIGQIGREWLTHMVELAQTIAPIVVLEGIETEHQLRDAKSAGVTHVQGKHISEVQAFGSSHYIPQIARRSEFRATSRLVSKSGAFLGELSNLPDPIVAAE